jgi:hypothetical protein
MFFSQKWNVLLVGTLLSIHLFGQDTISCDQSCHCFRNLTPAGVMISHVHPKKEWMFSYRYMRMNGSDNIIGTKNIDELSIFNDYIVVTPSMNMDMHMLMGMYGLTDRLTLMGMMNFSSQAMSMEMLPAIGHSHDMEMENNTRMEMRSSGFSDSKIHLLVGLIKKFDQQFILGVGLNLPTGSIEMKGLSNDMFYSNSRLPYMMQLGSGTFDFLPSVTYSKQSDHFAFSFQASSALRFYSNNVGYQLGNEYQFNIWGAYNWWKGFSSSLRFENQFVNSIKGSDKLIYAFNEIAANPLNYGGNKVLSYIGTAFDFKKGFLLNSRISLEYGFPIYQKVNGIQNKYKQSIMASLSYSF